MVCCLAQILSCPVDYARPSSGPTSSFKSNPPHPVTISLFPGSPNSFRTLLFSGSVQRTRSYKTRASNSFGINTCKSASNKGLYLYLP